MKKNDKVSTEKTYFSCLDIYESSAYNLEQSENETSYSDFARKPGTTLLTRYTILKVLKENAFGFIYLVERINKHTKYIIKEFFPHDYVTRNNQGDMILNTPLDIDSLIRFNYMQNFFMGEANNLEKVSIKPHENILNIASVEKNKNNTTYIIYPHKEGMTFHRYMEIKSRMGKDQLDSKGLDKILKPLLSAVKHLHSLGIYHLNIKPENILIQENGDLLLSGFESSTFFNDDDSRVFCNAYTLPCAAPEQIRNNGATSIGPESDIYGIGVLLYKMVTGGYPPDAKERIKCIEKDIQYDPYISLQKKEKLLAKYDYSLLYAIDKSMMFSTKDRFKDIKSFEDALVNPESVADKSVLKNKKNLLWYFLLSLAVIYIVFEGLNKIGDDEVAAIPSPKIIDKVTTEQPEIEKESIDTEYIDKDKKDDIEFSKNIDEKHLDEIKDTAADSNITSVSESKTEKNEDIVEDSNEMSVKEEQDLIVEEEINITSVSKSQTDENDVSVVDIKKKIEKTKPVENTKFKIEKSKVIKVDKKVEKIKTPEVKVNDVLKIDKTVQQRSKKILQKRKKRVVRKKKIIKKKSIEIKKKTSSKTSSGLVWFCKAIGGNIRASARNSDKTRSKNMALGQCRRKAGSQKNCRILNCFLLR